MRTLLICHHDARLDRDVMPRWLSSFSDYAGAVVIRDPVSALWRRMRRELRRSGLLGLADVVAFRLYYRLFLAGCDRRREDELARTLEARYAPAAAGASSVEVGSPNSAEALAFVREARPDVVLARCKHLLKPEVFALAATGTFALHPGICPQYRNAHGCFWALARGDRENVGMTLLKIDQGIDTGPIYGYFRRPVSDPAESHVGIQARVVYENLPEIQELLLRIHAGTTAPLPVSGGPSAVWGQPRLSWYWRWKRAA